MGRLLTVSIGVLTLLWAPGAVRGNCHTGAHTIPTQCSQVRRPPPECPVPPCQRPHLVSLKPTELSTETELTTPRIDPPPRLQGCYGWQQCNAGSGQCERKPQCHFFCSTNDIVRT